MATAATCVLTGLLGGAAWAQIEGIRADSRDPRALQLLKKLVVDHPELAPQFTLLLETYESERTKEH